MKRRELRDESLGIAKETRACPGVRPATALRPSLLRGLCIGAILSTIVVSLVSCGDKKPTRIIYEISSTEVYRGVFVRAPGVLTPGSTGSLTLSVVHVWDAQRPIPDPVSPEAVATIDSVTIQVVTVDGRGTVAGRLDRSSGALIVSGASWLNGSLINGRFMGTDPYGGFIAIYPTTQTIKAYVGSWSGTRPSGDDRGRVSFVIDGSVVTGIARNDDGTIDWVEGSYGPKGDIVMTLSGYRFAGMTSRYAIFGSYESTIDGGRSGNWTSGPCPF